MIGRESRLIWACVDCYVLHVNGDIDPGLGTDAAALLLSKCAGAEITAGMLDHDDNCTLDTDGECECETRDFSWSHCAGCGSTLGGSRHALTLWFHPSWTVAPGH